MSFRTSTERPEALDKGNIVIGNIKSEYVINSIDLAIGMFKNKNKNNKIKPVDYNDDNVSEKVIKIIQSYTPIINKIVWYK